MRHNPTGNHAFSQVPSANIERSTFDRSHTIKTTFDSGLLIPIYVDEVLPGDTFKGSMNAFARLATPVKPFMDNLYLDSFFFFVPNRLIWDNWEKFNGQQDAPDDPTDYLVPCFEFGTGTADVTLPAVHTTFDYMGIPVNISVAGYPTNNRLKINSLHHRAYHLIWNNWFRDQNLQDPVTVDKDDGPDSPATYRDCLRRGKRHDYFTSCLPWPQKGPDVTIPVILPESGFEVKGIGRANGQSGYSDFDYPLLETGGLRTVAFAARTNASPMAIEVSEAGTPIITGQLNDAVAASINSLREAFQLQRLYERDARGGTRYTEIIRSHFGVVSPDARLQRPEYLGGGSTRINVHPIAQTSVSAATPQGNLAAFGTASMYGHGFNKSFTEHGVIIGMVSVRADLTYMQGINRMFQRRTRFDYFWPALAHLGEQVVHNGEILLSGEDSYDQDVWGYQERYAEYRYKPSMITGKFRPNSQLGTGSLDVWHLAQELAYSPYPELSAEFIEENPPVGRVVVTPSEPEFLFDAYIDLKCTRPMPVYSVPGLIDHF